MEINDEPGTTPLEWLWQEIARRHGAEEMREIHLLFNARNRAYQKQKIAEGKERRRKEIQRLLAEE